MVGRRDQYLVVRVTRILIIQPRKDYTEENTQEHILSPAEVCLIRKQARKKEIPNRLLGPLHSCMKINQYCGSYTPPS